jgi:cytidylate kinase
MLPLHKKGLFAHPAIQISLIELPKVNYVVKFVE